MSAAAIIAFLSQIAGELSSSSSIAAAIGLLTQIISVVDEEITTIGPEIKNIIVLLSGNSAATPQQLADMATLDAQVDAAFDAAAAAAGAPADPSAAPAAGG